MTEFRHDTIVPFRNSTSAKKEQVADMFDKIAFRYDFLNRFLSAGIDQGWRKKTIQALADIHPLRILDVATGTADMPVMMMKRLRPEKITGIDISEGMLALGRKKIKRLELGRQIELRKGDAETMEFPDHSFDAVTVAFGVRNFQHLEKGLREMNRVLRPGGRIAILECTKPDNSLLLPLYKFYLRSIAPGIGKIVSGSGDAYQYLNASVLAFPQGSVFLDILEKNGFREARMRRLSLGISTLYTATK